MVLHPVGSLPPGAYWLRRLLVLVLVVLLAAGGWWLVGKIGDDGGSAPAARGSGPLPSGSGSPVSATTTPTPSGSPTATAHGPSPTSSRSPSPTSTAACAPSAVSVRAATDASSYAPGVQPRLTVQVTNTASTPCRRDLGRAALELVVASGTTRTWSSDDCNPGGSHAVVTLRPGQTFSTTVAWNRQASRPGCRPASRAAVGSYRLVARNMSTNSAPVPFSLH